MPTSRSTNPPVTNGDTPLDTDSEPRNTPDMDTRTSRTDSRATGGRRISPVLTEENIATICESIENGIPQGAAAAALGIPKRTFQDWLAAGRATGAEGLYADLANGIDEAIARFHEARAVEVIRHAEKDPRSAMFLLERRFPDEWADHTKAGVNVHVNVQASPEWRELLARVSAVLREKHPDALRTLAEEFGYRPEEPLQLEAA